MSATKNLKKFKAGVFYREHPTRKRDTINKDRQWVVIQYFTFEKSNKKEETEEEKKKKRNEVRKVSTLGWEKLDGIPAGDALNKADFYRANYKWNRGNPTQPPKPICRTDEKAIEKLVRKEILEELSEPTITEFSERFLKQHAERHLKLTTAKEYRRQFKAYINPKFGNRRLADIQKKHIIKLIEDIGESTPIMANRVLATLKSMFTYAVNVDMLKISPASGIKPPGKVVAKDRVLDLDEITTLFHILEDYPLHDLADTLRLIVLTGLRPGEIIQMKLAQLKKEEGDLWLELGQSETKNKQVHRAFLNKLATTLILNRIEKINSQKLPPNPKAFLFPAKTASGHLRIDVLVNKVGRFQQLANEKGINQFTAHDLRRSAATGIAQLGHWAVVPDILGHKPQGVTRKHYDLYSREPEIKKALNAWGEKIENKLNEPDKSNIIELRDI